MPWKRTKVWRKNSGISKTTPIRVAKMMIANRVLRRQTVNQPTNMLRSTLWGGGSAAAVCPFCPFAPFSWLAGWPAGWPANSASLRGGSRSIRAKTAATAIADAPIRIVLEKPTKAASGPPSIVATSIAANAPASERPTCFSYSLVRPSWRSVSKSSAWPAPE